MNDKWHHDMAEATRLTRAGRLGEATAFLQRLLRGNAAPESESAETIEAPDSQPGPGRPHMPEVLRGLLDRVKRIGAKPFPARAPETVPGGGQFIAESYTNQAGSRGYKLYIPTGYRGQALPLVVMLHGCTQSPDDFAAGTRMNAFAEEHVCLVAYPAQAASANSSKCWNWFSPGDQQRDQGEPSLIAGITRQIMRDYAVDPQRVYVAGLSAGAAAAVIVAMAYPDLYAAAGVHSGLPCGAARNLPSALTAMRQGSPTAMRYAGGASDSTGFRRVVPTIVFHGDQDKTVHPCNGDHVIAQWKALTATELQTRVQRGEVPGGHAYSRTLHVDANEQAILEQWVVHGAGHAWSGGSPAGSYTDPRGPDAAREMLRFFFAHRHPMATHGA
jgi:poly(hydroxyalkanoate) depolymerase family esterase